MEHDKNDPAIVAGSEKVSEGFRAVGAIPGDTVFFHGSLSSMGAVKDGPITVINGALAAVGPAGTVAMPTLWYNGKEPRNNPKDFDINNSPSYVGALSEALRIDPRSVRSDNFSHSVSAIGARAAALTFGHDKCCPSPSPWSSKAFSKGSPWDRLYTWNALYCFIGVTMGVCTMKHYIEARLVAECLAQAAPERRDGLRARLSSLGVPGIWPFYNSENLAEVLAKRNLVSFGKIGSATIQGIRTRILVDETTSLLRSSPQDWLGQPFIAWRAECVGGKVLAQI